MAKDKTTSSKQNNGTVADGVATHNELTFEQALADLESLVRKLEDGQLDMDQALAAYEQGLARLKRCHALLASAEQKVQLLAGVEAEGNALVKPLEIEPS